MQYLPCGVLDRVIRYVEDVATETSTLPNPGLSTGLGELVNRRDFWPDHLLKTIDEGRGEMTIAEYLNSHGRFVDKFGTCSDTEQTIRHKPGSWVMGRALEDNGTGRHSFRIGQKDILRK